MKTIALSLCLSVISSFLLLISGCVKNKDNSTTYNDYIDPQMNDFSFQDGSYWVYKNDSVNKTDCTYLINNLHSSYTEYQGQGVTIKTEFRQLVYHDEQVFPGSWFGGYLDCVFGRQIVRNLTPPKHNGTDFLVFSLDTTSLLKRLDSHKVGNVTYKDFQMRVFDSNTFFYVKRVGLIKKIIVDSNHVRTTWNLIKCKIIFPDNR